jgi:hypothetical protein
MSGHRVSCSSGSSDRIPNISNTIIRTPNEDVQAVRFHENSPVKRVNQIHSEDSQWND